MRRTIAITTTQDSSDGFFKTSGVSEEWSGLRVPGKGRLTLWPLARRRFQPYRRPGETKRGGSWDLRSREPGCCQRFGNPTRWASMGEKMAPRGVAWRGVPVRAVASATRSVSTPATVLSQWGAWFEDARAERRGHRLGLRAEVPPSVWLHGRVAIRIDCLRDAERDEVAVGDEQSPSAGTPCRWRSASTSIGTSPSLRSFGNFWQFH